MDYSLSKKDFWNSNPSYLEKLTWKLKNEHDPLWPIYADKLKAKEIAINNNIPVPKLLLKTKDPDSINFSSLPDMCMFKANHGCSWNCLYYKGRFFFIKKIHQTENINDYLNTAKESSKETFLYFFRNILKRKYTGWKNGLCKHEWYYDPIDPWVYAEELVLHEDGGMPGEAWFYMIRGQIGLLAAESYYNNVDVHYSLDQRPQKTIWRTSPGQFYRGNVNSFIIKNNSLIEVDTDFKKKEMDVNDYETMKKLIPHAQTLAGELEQVRLDFLLCNNKYYFLECTLATGGGLSPHGDWLLSNSVILESWANKKWTYK